MDSHHWIFLSPHFDDAVLSCGALIWELTRQGKLVEVWTLMGGIPAITSYSDFAQQMHQTMGMVGDEVVRVRRQEDRTACEMLGAQQRYFDNLDVIYRQDPHSGTPMVNNDTELFGKQPEKALVEMIAHQLQEEVPKDARVVVPISLGSHIDHRAVAQAGEALNPRYHYADYPYVLKAFEKLNSQTGILTKIPQDLSEDALTHWQDAVLCYASQLSMFWRDEQDTRLALRNYLAGGGGRLWETAAQ